MRQDIIQRVAIFADGHDLQAKAIKDDTLILLLTEDHLLAMAKYNRAVFTRITLSYALMYTVIEDHTVHPGLRQLRHPCAEHLLPYTARGASYRYPVSERRSDHVHRSRALQE